MADNDQPTTELSIWADQNKLAEIKGLVAQNLTNTEFQLLVNIGKATDLNPFLREIYAVKYGNAPASIFIGKNGYIKIANSHPAYDGHETEYIRDDKGAVIGCKATVYHKKRAHPVTIEVYLEEYGSGSNPLWKSKRLTMIRKVALVQALRESFPESFQGVYDESEEWSAPAAPQKPTQAPAAPKPSPATSAPLPAAPATPKPSVKQLEEVETLMRELEIDDEAKNKARKMMTSAANAAVILEQLKAKRSEQLAEMKAEAIDKETGEVLEPLPELTHKGKSPEELQVELDAGQPDPVEDDETIALRQIREEVKSLITPSVDKSPLVQLEEAFAAFCGSDTKPETATLIQWQTVRKILKARRKEQEKAVAEAK